MFYSIYIHTRTQTPPYIHVCVCMFIRITNVYKFWTNDYSMCICLFTKKSRTLNNWLRIFWYKKKINKFVSLFSCFIAKLSHPTARPSMAWHRIDQTLRPLNDHNGWIELAEAHFTTKILTLFFFFFYKSNKRLTPFPETILRRFACVVCLNCSEEIHCRKKRAHRGHCWQTKLPLLIHF